MVTQFRSDPYATTVRLPSTARSVGRARVVFRLDAVAWRLPVEEAETATLLLSELLTNACRHTRVPRDRYVEANWSYGPGDRVLRLEVSDADRTLPKPRQAGPEDESGRGLELLAALATTWGVEPREGGIGKTVWCELKVPGHG